MPEKRYFEVVNLDQFQHYRDRNPPWIKLHNFLLDDYDFACLQDASKLHLIAIWLLASRSSNRIPCNPQWIAHRINATAPVDLEVLESGGFIRALDGKPITEQKPTNGASRPLAARYQGASKPLERGETEGEGEREFRPNGRSSSLADANPTSEISPSGQEKSNGSHPRFAEQAREVFDHWRTVCEHPRARLDAKRQSAITRMLKAGYSVAELCEAVTGCSLSPFHQGENGSAKVYDDIALICRDASHVDDFLRTARNPPAKGVGAKTRGNISAAREWLEEGGE